MQSFAERIVRWYEETRRDLPWRRTRDPYRIWLSEIMLQQTRVAAVIPYYERFLARFPDFRSLAEAPEEELLALWAGLGYYSRARNLQKAAQQMKERGGFPEDYDSIRELPGVGDYTAAAVGSIAFGLPVAVLDGNVIRVLARVSCEEGDVGNARVRGRLRQTVQDHIDPSRPGDYNQGLMELGATICLPKNPKCLICPINDICCARGRGIENSLPIKLKKASSIEEERAVLVVRRDNCILLWQRAADSKRLAGFWELPERESLKQARCGPLLGQFRHGIVNHIYEVSVYEAKLPGKAPGLYKWISWEDLRQLPLSTITRKGLEFVQKKRGAEAPAGTEDISHDKT